MFLNSSARKRILFCIKGNCADPADAEALIAQTEALISRHGLDAPDHPNHTVVSAVNCLGVCQNGAVMMVHPGAIRYGNVDAAKLKRIFEAHILNDTPPAELVLPYPQPKKVPSKKRK